ncbi:MAG: chromate transporter [Rikenellaceae bacterium]
MGNIKKIESIKYSEVKLHTLLLSFLKIGLVTFGGGYAMIPLIREEIIDRRGWVNDDEFIDLLTIAQSTPGPIALNTAAFVGYRTRGYLGTLVSLGGIIIPSFVIIMVIALGFNFIRDNHYVEAAFKAMRPVVVALILAPTLSLMRGMSISMIALSIMLMGVMVLFNLSPLVLIASAIIGALTWSLYTSKCAKK